MIEDILLLTSFVALGIVIGISALWIIQRIKLFHFKHLAAKILQKAESEGESIRQNGEMAIKKWQLEKQQEIDTHLQQEKRRLQNEESRLTQKEERIETRMSLIEKKLSDIEKREAVLLVRRQQLEDERQQLTENQLLLQSKLEAAAGLTSTEAREHLLNIIANEIKNDSANLIRRTLKEAHEEAEKEAAKIIATAINRMAVPCVNETTVNTVMIPNDELKGRIIGREGRNIRALERATGVTIIIDDTPGTIVLSGFDPIRMQIAKMAISELAHDGRIHPTSIEEAVERAKHSVHKLIKKMGEEAALRVGILNLHPEIITLLGKLKFRFSLGQNVLEHSLEVAHLMGIMAEELGLDAQLAKRIGLLHDMGKAVTHEIEGTHAIIGHDLALKYGETKEVANGIGCHHGEMEAETIEASLCSAADAISASRQGARSESVDEYVRRIRRLEDLVSEYPCVEKAYALQAGREIRVVVLPETIDDDGIVTLARDLTKRIEKEMSYPGKIKVTIIREKRVVEYAC